MVFPTFLIRPSYAIQIWAVLGFQEFSLFPVAFIEF